MKRRQRWLVWLLAASVTANTGCAAFKTGVGRRPDPVLGTFIAVVPGFFVHGLGNRYAGRKARANELMREGGLGLLLLGLGTGLFFLGLEENDSADDQDGVLKFLRQAGAIASFAGAAAGLLVGGLFFFDSWLQDIYETPGACADYGEDDYNDDPEEDPLFDDDAFFEERLRLRDEEDREDGEEGR